VVFSGFPGKGKPPCYNYVLKFSKLRCNKLYILDNFGFDSRGSYYLGRNRDFYVARAVTQLIEKIASECKIDNDNIITAGTSKGGFASLYFAISNKFGASIAGEPQIMLGDYLSFDVHIDILEFICGKVNDSNLKFLNNVIFEEINKAVRFPRLYLHFGKGGYHYDNHWLPLKDKLDQKGIEYSIDFGKYQSHEDVGTHFHLFAINSINKELNFPG